MTTKSFRPWRVDETWLLPPSVEEFVPAGHPAHLIRDIVREELDLGAILSAYTEARGFPPYDPGMMVALLLYAYSQGVYSSRRIARGCEERLDFQAVTALNQPDFRTVSEFRRRHLAALGELTAQQRGLYTRVFGDPLDWVRRRLGHRSLTSTMIYLHALAELEMHTRMALVPDGWDAVAVEDLADGGHEVAAA